MKSIFQKAFDALAPGGFFEMQDAAAPLESIDSSIEGTAMPKMSKMIGDTTAKMGIDLTAAKMYKEMMEEVGFVDVKEVRLEWPIGTWAKSAYHKRIGRCFRGI